MPLPTIESIRFFERAGAIYVCIDDKDVVLDQCFQLGIVHPVVAVSVYSVQPTRSGYGASYTEVGRYFSELLCAVPGTYFEWDVGSTREGTLFFCATIIGKKFVSLFQRRREDRWMYGLFTFPHLTLPLNRRYPPQCCRAAHHF